MEQIVKGCGDCPFKDEMPSGVYSYCKHPQKYLERLYETDNGELILPSNCPLIKEIIIIKLEA